MNCTFCRDRLADFLTDELPESEAVLVHEHINICADCRRRYNELKGTGMALEAVSTMRSVHGSDAFHKAVRESALVELNSMIRQLPADQRRVVEARLENAKGLYEDNKPALKQPWYSRFWSTAALVTLLLGGAAYCYSLVQAPALTPEPALTTTPDLEPLKVATEPRTREGGVEMPGQHSGNTLLPHNAPVTSPRSSARRIDLLNQGQLLLAPNSFINLPNGPLGPDAPQFVIEVESGEIDIWRYECTPGAPLGANETPWQVNSQYGSTQILPGTRMSIGLSNYDDNFEQNPAVEPATPESFSRVVRPNDKAKRPGEETRESAPRETPRKEQISASPMPSSARPADKGDVRPLAPVNPGVPMTDPAADAGKPMN